MAISSHCYQGMAICWHGDGGVVFEVEADDVLVVLGHIQQQGVRLWLILGLLLVDRHCDAAECHHSCLVQPAVGACSVADAALVISTALQH
jgi:hypothetical protein